MMKKYLHKSLIIAVSELTEELVKMKNEGWELLYVEIVNGLTLYCDFRREKPDRVLEELDKTIIYWTGEEPYQQYIVKGLEMAKEIYKISKL